MVEGELVEEEETNSLAARFSTWVRKWSATLESEATSSSGEKRPRWSPSGEGAQKDWAMVLVEPPDQSSNDQPA